MKSFLNKRNQRILYIATIILAAASILDVVWGLFPFPVSMLIYVCAAVSFFSSFALWIRTFRILLRVVVIPFTEQNKILSVVVKDYRLRTVLMTLPGLGMNFIFAVFNAVVGITGHSAWYGSLAAYYILLCVMRFVSVMYAKSIYLDKNDQTQEQRELKVYKTCGILLSIMSLALVGAVIMLVTGEGGKSYPGMLIYAVAFYTFYKLTMSVKNMVRARKENSVLTITLRYIGHSEALVSMLSLQTAMFTSFGQGEEDMIPIMNAATGAAVCLAALVLGLFMVRDAGRRQRTKDKGKTDHRETGF